jgi:hypothetical protein
MPLREDDRMDPTGAFGNQLGRYFGLEGAPSLSTSRLTLARRPAFAVTRLCCGIDQLGLKREIPPEDAFVLMLFLAGLAHVELWQRGRPIKACACPSGSISIFHLADELSVYIGGPLDCLSFYIPRELMDQMTDAAGEPRILDLRCPPGRADPTIEQIGLALLPLIETPESMAPTFLDHIAIATSVHVAQAYGNFQPGGPPETRRRLASAKRPRAPSRQAPFGTTH